MEPSANRGRHPQRYLPGQRASLKPDQSCHVGVTIWSMIFGPTRTTQIVNSGAQVLFVTDEEISRNSAVTWHIHCHCACDAALDDHSTVRAVCLLLADRVFLLAPGRTPLDRTAGCQVARGIQIKVGARCSLKVASHVGTGTGTNAALARLIFNNPPGVQDVATTGN